MRESCGVSAVKDASVSVGNGLPTFETRIPLREALESCAKVQNSGFERS